MVGVVENPSDFDDEFALVAPGHLDRRDTVTILTSAGSDRVESFRSRMTVPATSTGRPGRSTSGRPPPS